MKFTSKWPVISALLFYLVIVLSYTVISLGRHLRFETHAYDLGIYDQVVWHLSRFERPESTIRGFDNYFLVDHFEPALFIIAPLYRLLATPYILLLVQLFFTLVVGALGLYKLLQLLTDEARASWLLVLAWSLSLGVQQALNFDFHTSVLAVGLYPWILYWWEKKKWRRVLGLVVICLLLKEETAFYLAGIAIFLIVTRKQAKLASALLVASVAWFLAVTGVVMTGYHFSELYENLGSSWLARIFYLVSPRRLLTSLFGQTAKRLTWRYFLFSSLGLGFISPGLVLILPGIMRNHLSSLERAWSLDFHYWIEAEYFLYISVAYFLFWLRKRLPSANFSSLAVKAAIFILVFTAFASLEEGRPLRDFANNPQKFFSPLPIDQTLREAFAKIPQDSAVSAQDTLVPHLSARRKVYLLFNLADSDFVIYSLSGFDYLTVYPVVREGFVEFDRKMRTDERYRLIFDQDGVVVFCRQSSQFCQTRP